MRYAAPRRRWQIARREPFPHLRFGRRDDGAPDRVVGEAGDPRPRAGGALVRVADEAGSLAVRDSGVGVGGVEGVGGLLEVQPLNLVGDGSERALGVARGRCARIVAARA